jgi:cytoskeletal protein RodZ
MMNRDVFTTAIGLILVGIVVVAVFLYGNHQHQSTVRKSQTAGQQSAPHKVAIKPSTKSTGPAKATTQQPATVKPSASNQTALQGGSHAAPSSTTTPHAAPTQIPQTGSEGLWSVVGAALIAALYQVHRRSRLAVVQAARRANS